MLVRLFSGTLASLLLSTASFAQCAEWDGRFAGWIPGADGIVAASAVFDDGTGPALFVAGDFASVGGAVANRIARWDGETWSPLGPSGAGANDDVTALAVFDDGSGPALYAGGGFTTIGGLSAQRIAKWDGTSWSALVGPGNGVNDSVHTLAVFDDGSGPALFVGGSFSLAGGLAAVRVAKWDGTSWSAVGPPGSSTNFFSVLSLCAFDDGSGSALYAGGYFTDIGGIPANRLAKWDGTSWSEVGGGLSASVLALLAFDDGSGPGLFVAGVFTTAGGVPAGRIAKWDGTAWSTLGIGANGIVRALAIHDAGSGPALHAGGDFTAAGGILASKVARWGGATWSALGAPTNGVNGPVVNTLTSFDDGSGPALLVGGQFTSAGGNVVTHVARWSDSAWGSVEPLGMGIDDSVYALATFDDGSGPALHAGGFFTRAGNTQAFDVAKWDGTEWAPLGSGMNESVRALAVFDDGSGAALFAGGTFSSAGGVPASRIAKWDGANWSTLGTGTNGSVIALAVFDDGSGQALYAGGSFSSAGGVPASNIAKWDGTSWSALGGGTGPSVSAMTVFDDGSGPALFVGGFFTSAGGAPANRIAKWDGASWSPVGAGGLNQPATTLLAHDDGSGPALFAGGSFTSAGGVAVERIAKWDGTTWSALGAGVSGSFFPGGVVPSVRALAAFDGGSGVELVATGNFTSAGGVPAQCIATWNGTSWSALGASNAGIAGGANVLAVFDDGADGDADLYAGGSFLSAGGLESERIAMWHGCPPVPQAFCFGDGSLAACPCANNGLAGRGCDNSAATGGALLSASGTTSPDTLVLTQADTLASSLSIFSQGTTELGAPVLFGDGLRCVGGALKRLYAKSAAAGTASAPEPGDASISARSAELGDPLSPGMVRYYYVYYRDPDASFCATPAGNTFNVGNALRVPW